jgi:hypothetical protein
MSDPETLSAEDKAYFDTRGETVAPETTTTEPETTTEEVAEPVAEEAEETAELTTDEADGEKPTGQSKVPLAALTKERQALKAEKVARAEAERKAAILEDRWNQALAQREEPPKPAAQQPPALDPNKDPLHVVNELLTDFQQRKQSEAEYERQTKEQQAANDAWDKTLNVARAQYEAAASADEAFEPTYVALRVSLGREYMEAYGLSEAQAKAEVDRYEAQQIAFAVDRGIDVATHMRKLAKARNVSAPAKEAPKPAEDLDKLAEGVNGSTSLSSAGGGRVASTTAQSVADMSPDEFAAWLGKDGNQAKFKKLAGG